MNLSLFEVGAVVTWVAFESFDKDVESRFEVVSVVVVGVVGVVVAAVVESESQSEWQKPQLPVIWFLSPSTFVEHQNFLSGIQLQQPF